MQYLKNANTLITKSTICKCMVDSYQPTGGQTPKSERLKRKAYLSFNLITFKG